MRAHKIDPLLKLAKDKEEESLLRFRDLKWARAMVRNIKRFSYLERNHTEIAVWDSDKIIFDEVSSLLNLQILYEPGELVYVKHTRRLYLIMMIGINTSGQVCYKCIRQGDFSFQPILLESVISPSSTCPSLFEKKI